jgi:ABC-type antimicrobial peptide transport system permease subunit
MTLRRDRWFGVGLVGPLLACVVCGSSVAVLGALGLPAWVRWTDVDIAVALAGLVLLAGSREWIVRRKSSDTRA